MDAVQSYGSDSESDEQDEQIVTPQQRCLSHSEKSTFNIQSGKQGSLTAGTALSDDVSCEQARPKDFFGISSLETKVAYLNEDVDKHESETETCEGACDIPDGKFWKDFDPEKAERETLFSGAIPQSPRILNAPNQQVSANCKSKAYGLKRNYVADNTASGFHREMYISSSSTKISRCGNQVKQHSFDFTHTCSGMESLQKQGICVQPDIAAEKRKMYYIHSKVSPFLNSRQNCRCISKCVSTWPSQDSSVNCVSWNIAPYSHLLLSTGSESAIKVWNVWSTLDKCVTFLPSHTKAVKQAQWQHDGKKIVSCSYDKSAAVTDVETSRIEARLMHSSFVTALALHPSNPYYMITGCEGSILLWDQRIPKTSVKEFRYKDKMGQIQDALFIQHGSELITCSDVVSRDSADRTVMAWDIQTGNVLSNQIYQERYTCTKLKLHPSNCHFLSQTHGGYVTIFSATRPYKMDKSKRCGGHQTHGYSIGFDISHDGSLVYSGSAVDGIHCYNYRTGKLIKKLSHDQNAVVTDTACHPVLSSVVAACTWGGKICLWQ